MTTYKLMEGTDNKPNSVLRNDNRGICSIPFDPDNIDYQEYLEWVAEGNTPEPADEE